MMEEDVGYVGLLVLGFDFGARCFQSTKSRGQKEPLNSRSQRQDHSFQILCFQSPARVHGKWNGKFGWAYLQRTRGAECKLLKDGVGLITAHVQAEEFRGGEYQVIFDEDSPDFAKVKAWRSTFMASIPGPHLLAEQKRNWNKRARGSRGFSLSYIPGLVGRSCMGDADSGVQLRSKSGT